ncbi:ABC transporter permease [Mycoplasmopsis californica]|uniref:ABC transporter permease n=1 Tax=Mycoplasmopsis californica TaxID=2113 RepID=UPI000596ED3C|nr:ABC transporter permease [Mycoplasmopsis californica]
MWRLFKEVFKSLSKNKVVVIGLSILVFLTSAIFTLLSSVRNVVVGGYNNYKTVSKLHDISVDLNLPTQGKAYNQGYIINGETLDNLSRGRNYEPIIYRVDQGKIAQYSKIANEYLDAERNILNLSKADEFIKLSEIGITNPSFSDKYFKKLDLIQIYGAANSAEQFNDVKSDYIFNLKNINDAYFSVKNTRKLPVYIQNGKEFTQVKTIQTLSEDTKISIKKPIRLGDILTLKSIAGKQYATQISELYLNVKTREITSDYTLGRSWIDEQNAFIITPSRIAGALGFKKNIDSQLFYEVDLNSPKLNNLFKNYNGVVSETLEFKESLFLKDLTGDLILVPKNQYYLLSSGQKYTLKPEWINNIFTSVEFLRNHYYTSYVGDLKDKWTGAFKTYIESLGDPRDLKRKAEWDKLETFANWRKVKIRVSTPYVFDKITNKWVLDSSKQEVVRTELPLSTASFYADIDKVSLYTNDNRFSPLGKAYAIDESQSKSIISIESDNLIGKAKEDFNKLYLENKQLLHHTLTNENILSQKYSFISSRAYEATKKVIIDKIVERVGAENVGLRQSVTVNAVDEKNGKQNTFHFINTGDQQFKINGLKLNVGGLYNEVKQPTALTKLSESSNSIYTAQQLNPFVSSLLIQSIFKNLYPDPDYISPIYDFATVHDTNPNGLDSNLIYNTKIVKLAHYDPKNTANPNGKSTIYGVIGSNNKFRIVEKNINDGTYNVVYFQEFNNISMDTGLLAKFLEKNKLTIATNHIKTSEGGWALKDNEFENVHYIPIYFLAPKNELMYDVLKNGRIDILAKTIEKYLLNSTFVKYGFISSTQVLDIGKILKKVLNKHNFASVFANGKLNQAIMPELINDFLYELSHDPKGDLLKYIITNVMQRALEYVSANGNIHKQKEKLVKEVETLLNTVKQLTQIDIQKIVNARAIVYASKNPNKVVESFIRIIDSINFKKFSEQARDWFINNNNKVVINQNTNEKYTTKLSSANIIKWVFSSIDQKRLKDALVMLIKNLDLELSLNLDNKDSLLHQVLGKFAPNLIQALKPIIKKINSGENGLEPYSNFKEGLINIINLINFDKLYLELSKATNTEFIDYQTSEINPNTSQKTSKIHRVLLERITPRAGINAFIKSIFSIQGSSRVFKDNLIKMFNLSGKTKEIKLNGTSQAIYIPDSDVKRVSFTDFVGIFNSLLKDKNSKIFKNYEYEQRLTKLQKEIQTASDFNFSVISNDGLALISELNLFNAKTTKEDALSKLQSLLDFIKQTKGGTNPFVSNANKTGTDWIFELMRFSDGNSSWQLIKNLISSVTKPKITNEYSLGAQTFDIYSPYIEMLLNPIANYVESSKFVRDFLNFALKPEILKLSQARSTADNIPFDKSLNYYITEYLQNPELITLFSQKADGKFNNSSVEELLSKNPKYRDWVIQNKKILETQIAYIGASQKFSSNNSTQRNGIYHYVISNFVENYLLTPQFYEIRNSAHKMLKSISPSFAAEIFGLSKALINPVMRLVFPEVPLTFLASQKNEKSLFNGNLAYLVLNKISNFELLAQENNLTNTALNQKLDAIFATGDTSSRPLNLDKNVNLVIDGPEIEHLRKIADTLPNVFGINFLKMIPELINQIVEPKAIKEVVFNSPASFVAKANFAYLSANNKAIFNGKIPLDPLKISEFINNLDSRYTIDVNGIKFIIVGEEISVDYMYPVIDENNLQVNVKNQGLVYVNQYGFARIKLAYSGNVVKQALLVKNNGTASDTDLKKEITKIVDDSISDSNNLQRVFLANELDPINPERALRLSTVDSIINIISVATIILLIVFTLVVGVSIVFIIKRYISNKNKVLGILVSQGYTASQIALSLTVFALVTSIIGGVMGYTIGNSLQLTLLNVFGSYWTLPKETISFDWISMVVTVFMPFMGMSLLIYLVSLISLRHSPVQLMSGSINIPTSKFASNYSKFTKKSNVKGRFSFMLFISNFWKLIAFGISALLTASATIFGMVTNNIFSKTVNNTYQNRHYTFKVDMETPTREGGPYKLYSPQNLNKNIYTPIGLSIESQREANDFFKPGYSSIVNAEGHNGIKKPTDSWYDSHVLTQFSASIKVDAGVSADPWLVAYNSMPDSQKAKIDKSRDKVGILLERTQQKNGAQFIIDPQTKYISLVDEKGQKLDFFKYYRSPFDKQGKFVWAHWSGTDYEMRQITTERKIRAQYRKFLVEGYADLDKKIKAEKENPKLIKHAPNGIEQDRIHMNYWLEDPGPIYGPTINDYFISFGGVYFENSHDEVYTYIQSKYNGKDIKIYGYQNNSPYVKLSNIYNQDLMKKMYNFSKNSVFPLVINEVAAKRYSLKVGDQIDLEINNHVDRYQNKLLNLAGIKTQTVKPAKFEVIGINQTFINNEFITRYDVANEVIGFNSLNLPNDFVKFNGVLTNNNYPLQVTNSTGLYSKSGYWSGIDSFDTETASIESMRAMFDQIYHPQNGVIAKSLAGIKSQQEIDNIIIKILDKNQVQFNQNVYDSIREQPKEAIVKYAQIYNDKLYVALPTTIDSKDIESGFAIQVGETIQTITVAIIALSFSISLIILIIMSTIMIGENQKNIAIWSIQGYNQKEKIKMYFSVYIPFILFAIILAIPLVLFIKYLFTAALLGFTGVALVFHINIWHILLTTLLLIAIFIVTSFTIWITINKMKPVDLLKGK